VRIAGIYLVVGLAWIAVSDFVVDQTLGGTDWLMPVNSIKGYVFIAVTAFLLFLLIRRELTALEAARAEAAAATSELIRLAAFPRFSPHPVVSVVRDGSLRYANQAARRLAADIGTPDARALLPGDLPDIVRHCLEADRETAEVEHSLGAHLLRWLFFPEPGGAAVYGFGKDATDEARVTARLIEAEKIEAVGRVTAGLAHDFNNLLMVVGLGGQVIEQDEEATDSIREEARAMRAAADQAAALVRRLLAFGRPQAPEMRHLDLNEEVRAFAPFARHVAERGTPVKVITDGEPLPVLADPGQLNQVLMNLVVNAADAIRESGQIEIATGQLSMAGSDFALLSVSDTGQGIPADVLPRIFEPFFTTKVDRGTGLGLSVVRDIVDRHAGQIAVDSVEDQGTTFRVLLPLADLSRGRQTLP
jgi:signal transduction histidine kinase